MKLLTVVWLMVFMISFEHGINVQGSARLSMLRISRSIQSSQYVTIIGNVAKTIQTWSFISLSFWQRVDRRVRVSHI
jgi:cAMP phosphodiesterase